MPRAFLLDLDGTLYTDHGPVPGAVDAVARLRQRRVPLRFVTNTTRRPRGAIVERLRGYGFEATAEEVFTAVMAGAALARDRRCHSVAPFLAESTLTDLGQFELIGGTAGRPPAGARPDAVLVGDLGDRWSYEYMQEAFHYLMAGAVLIACSRDRYFQRADGLALDAGAFVAGLEFASGATALVAGKPAPEFFQAAVRSVGLSEDESATVAVIGDDIRSDIGGAQRAGLAGWLVRTGKFRPEQLTEAEVIPDRVLDSVADLAD